MSKKIALIALTAVLLISMSSLVFAETLTIRPNGQGYYAQWSNTGCGSGSSEWQCVDEDPANTGDYLWTWWSNRKETFDFEDTGLTDETINNITLYYYAKRYSSWRYKIQPMIRESSSDYYGSVKNLGSGYAYASQVYTTNPATGNPWTVAEVDALEAGMRSYTSNYGGYVAQAYAVVDYEPSGGPEDSCNDTDGGNIITIFGTTSGYLSGNPYSNDDYCVNNDTIMEYYCSGDYEQSQQQSCGTDAYTGDNYCLYGDVYRDYVDYYCLNGECDSDTTPVLQQDCVSGQYCSNGACYWNDSCSDTDGGNIIDIFGTTSGYLNGTPYSNDDYCIGSENIMEYYCIGNYETNMQQSCGTDSYGSPYCSAGDKIYKDYTDYFCGSGECDYNVTPIFQEDCDDNDGYGPNYCINSSVYHDFYDYFCSSGACDNTTTPEWVEDCEYGCSGGECNPIPDSCSDTDGGNMTFVFGTTSGYFNNTPYSNDDYCVDSSSVMEYYCIGNYETSIEQDCGTDSYIGGDYCINSSVYRDYKDYFCSSGECDYTITPIWQEDCEYGCTDGECNPIPDSCSDTDGGWGPTILGNVSGYLNEIYYEDTDYCIDNTTLKEYYCVGNYAYNENVDCLNVTNSTMCYNGACI